MKRYLLVTAALSVASGCKREQPLPGNPKGSVYDAGVVEAALEPTAAAPSASAPPPPSASASASATVTAKPSATVAPTVPTRHPLPANPKGSHYDKGNDPW